MGLATQVLTHLAAGETALAALADALGRDKKDIVKAAQILKRRGLLARVDGSGPRAYALTVAGQRRAEQGQAICSGQGRKPRQKTIGLRERAWWEVWAKKTVSLQQILSTHAEGGEKAGAANVYKYLVALEKAGLITRLNQRLPAKQSTGRVQWQLTLAQETALKLGPQAPVWRQQAHEVYDPNSGAVHPIPKAAPAGEPHD